MPCLVTVVFYIVDLARGSHLIIRSLLGPNPRFGSRFYGIGNELEASLPVLLFVGLAALLYGRDALARGRRDLRRRRAWSSARRSAPGASAPTSAA